MLGRHGEIKTSAGMKMFSEPATYTSTKAAVVLLWYLQTNCNQCCNKALHKPLKAKHVKHHLVLAA